MERVGTNNAKIKPPEFKTSLSEKCYVNPFPPLSNKEANIFFLLRYDVVLRDAVPVVCINLTCKLLFDG